MAEGSDQEKTEKATPKKREDARRKGQVAQSREIPSVAVLLVALSFFYFGGSWMFGQLTDLTRDILQRVAQGDVTAASTHLMMSHLLLRIFILLAPLVAAIIVAGVGANVIQVGLMWSGETLKPKLSQFNPINGLKNLVSLTALVELAKSILKIAIVGGVAYRQVAKQLDQIPALVELPTAEIIGFIGKVSLNVGFYTCLVLIILAGLDFIFQRWQHEKKLRMTKQEVKDEYKQREGDPQVRSRIRKAQMEMAMKRMFQEIPKATVVITNPTHLAVALRFDRSMPAPQVVAKGAGEIAARIRAAAAQHGIPIIEQKPLAQALFRNVELDHYIPADLYHAVAEILAYVYRLKGLAG